MLKRLRGSKKGEPAGGKAEAPPLPRERRSSIIGLNSAEVLSLQNEAPSGNRSAPSTPPLSGSVRPSSGPQYGSVDKMTLPKERGWKRSNSRGRALEEELIKAIKDNRLDRVKELVQSGMVDLNYRSGAALFQAVQQNSLPALNILLQGGANVNFEATYGETALHIAAKKGCHEIVDALLRAGAKPDNNGPIMSPVQLAAEEGHAETVKVFIEHNIPIHDGAIHFAAEKNHTGVLSMLKQMGIDLDFEVSNGYGTGTTPIQWAAKHKAWSSVRFLVESGVDVNCRATQEAPPKSCPLHYAVKEGQVDIVAFLVQSGADPYLKDEKDKTAHDYAKEEKNKELDHALSQPRISYRREISNNNLDVTFRLGVEEKDNYEEVEAWAQAGHLRTIGSSWRSQSISSLSSTSSSTTGERRSSQIQDRNTGIYEIPEEDRSTKSDKGPLALRLGPADNYDMSYVQPQMSCPNTRYPPYLTMRRGYDSSSYVMPDTGAYLLQTGTGESRIQERHSLTLFGVLFGKVVTTQRSKQHVSYLASVRLFLMDANTLKTNLQTLVESEEANGRFKQDEQVFPRYTILMDRELKADVFPDDRHWRSPPNKKKRTCRQLYEVTDISQLPIVLDMQFPYRHPDHEEPTDFCAEVEVELPTVSTIGSQESQTEKESMYIHIPCSPEDENGYAIYGAKAIEVIRRPNSDESYEYVVPPKDEWVQQVESKDLHPKSSPEHESNVPSHPTSRESRTTWHYNL